MKCSTPTCKRPKYNRQPRCKICQRTHNRASHEVRKALDKMSKNHPALADYLRKIERK